MRSRIYRNNVLVISVNPSAIHQQLRDVIILSLNIELNRAE